MVTAPSHVRVDDRGEQVVPVGELAAVQEVPLDDVVSPVAQRSGAARVREKLGDRVAEAAEISGVDQQAAVLVLNLLAVTADIACDTARRFHKASVTPSPKPSSRLFSTITSAWRWSA